MVSILYELCFPHLKQLFELLQGDPLEHVRNNTGLNDYPACVAGLPDIEKVKRSRLSLVSHVSSYSGVHTDATP